MYLCPTVTGWPSYTPRCCVPFSSPWRELQGYGGGNQSYYTVVKPFLVIGKTNCCLVQKMLMYVVYFPCN
jgi:hypothetical protein